MERLVLKHVSQSINYENDFRVLTVNIISGTAAQKLPPQPEQEVPQLEVVQTKDVTDHVQVEQKSMSSTTTTTSAKTVVESTTSQAQGIVQ